MRIFKNTLRRLGERGDTLVEITIALAILTTVLTGATTVAIASAQIGRIAEERTEAVDLAQQQAERLRSMRDNLVEASNATGWTSFSSQINAAGAHFWIDPCSGGNAADAALQYCVTSAGHTFSYPADPMNGTGSVTASAPVPVAAGGGTYDQDGTQEYKVDITVSWTNAQGQADHTTISEYLGDTSFAPAGAPPPPPPPPPVIVEGENFPPGPNGPCPFKFPDGLASNGVTGDFCSTSSSTYTFSGTLSSVSINVRATRWNNGDGSPNGDPRMIVSVDGTVISSLYVDNTGYLLLGPFPDALGSGAHTITINYPNDAYSGSNPHVDGFDRDLFVDYVQLNP